MYTSLIFIGLTACLLHAPQLLGKAIDQKTLDELLRNVLANFEAMTSRRAATADHFSSTSNYLTSPEVSFFGIILGPSSSSISLEKTENYKISVRMF
jgi:hypothetical protein